MKKSSSIIILSILCILLLCSSALASSRLVTTTLVGNDNATEDNSNEKEEGTNSDAQKENQDSNENASDILDTLRDILENEEESNVTIEHPKREEEKIDYTADRKNNDDKDDEDALEEYRRDKESDTKITTTADLSGKSPRISISQEERREIKEAIKSKKIPKNETVKKIIQRKKQDRNNYDSIIDMVRNVLSDDKKEKAVDALLGMDKKFVKKFYTKQKQNQEQKNSIEKKESEPIEDVAIMQEDPAIEDIQQNKSKVSENKKESSRDQREKRYEEQIEEYLEALEKPETIKVELPEEKIKEIITTDSDFDAILNELWE